MDHRPSLFWAKRPMEARNTGVDGQDNGHGAPHTTGDS